MLVCFQKNWHRICELNLNKQGGYSAPEPGDLRIGEVGAHSRDKGGKGGYFCSKKNLGIGIDKGILAGFLVRAKRNPAQLGAITLRALCVANDGVGFGSGEGVLCSCTSPRSCKRARIT